VTSSETGRARPLPPDERRAKLIAATLPLLCRYGPKVTTRQIAEAAGVAEGTIFRVFPHKDGLVRVAISEALDPSPTIAELLGVDIELPLRERLVVVTDILQRRLIQVFDLMIAIRMHGPPPEEHDPRQKGATGASRHEAILNEIVRLLEPDQDQFRCPVPEVARVLRLLTFSASHPMITDGQLMTAEEIATIVLDGTRRQSRQPETDERGNPC
jgi:AcrR family transcriptional regulator